MAMEIEFLCMANSRKLGGRCIAGIDLKTGQWIRLVKSNGTPFALPEIKFSDETIPLPLDQIKVGILKYESSYYHPENCLIDSSHKWEKIGQKSLNSLISYIDNDESFIFRDASDRLNVVDLKNNPLPRSLMLIAIENPTFIKQKNAMGKVQVKVKFTFNENEYTLVVTDPEWEAKFKKKVGPFWDFGPYIFDGYYYLVIGVGEKFGSHHYKLAVAVIPKGSSYDLPLESGPS